MMYVLHGEDAVASRDKLFSLKQQYKNLEQYAFTGDQSDITDIIQVFESQSLFDERKLIIVERFLQTKQKVLVASLLNHIKNYDEHVVILWEGQEIKKELLPFFPKTARIESFAIPKIIFQFLDNLLPGNTKRLLRLYHDLLQQNDAERVFYMIVRQFRILLALTEPGEKKIDEVKRMQSWQQGKLQKQVTSFGEKRLKEIYVELFAIETAIKTGGLSLPLDKQLDIFLATL